MKKFKAYTPKGEREFNSLKEAVLNDMGSSFDLKRWIVETDNMDPVDAVKRSQILFEICKERANNVFKTQNKQ